MSQERGNIVFHVELLNGTEFDVIPLHSGLLECLGTGSAAAGGAAICRHGVVDAERKMWYAPSQVKQASWEIVPEC